MPCEERIKGSQRGKLVRSGSTAENGCAHRRDALMAVEVSGSDISRTNNDSWIAITRSWTLGEREDDSAGVECWTIHWKGYPVT